MPSNSSAIIFYFSGTGNTWWATQKLALKLTEQKTHTVVLSIENEQLKNPRVLEEKIQNVDLIGFGYPIYGSDCPRLVLEFIKSLPEGSNKSAFVFTTMMFFSGDGAMVVARVLRKKGYRVEQAVNIKMMNNLRLPYPIFRSLEIKNGEDIKGLKYAAEKKIEKLVAHIVAGKRWLQGRDPFNIFGGLLQRITMRTLLPPSSFAKHFFVSKELCTECMQCVDFCPTANITFDGAEFHFGSNCLFCLRCYNLCPQNALQHKKGTLQGERFPRYKGPGNGFQVKKLKE